MGLSRIEVRFLELGLKMGLFPAGMHILELGESTIIPEDGTADLLSLLAPLLGEDRVAQARLRAEAARIARSEYQRLYGPARAVYDAIFRPASYTAIDLDLQPRQACFDLNGPVNLGSRFDLVINNGTSEHVFDQANVFRIMHDHTRPGGFMMHWVPCLGWIDHGLYNVQPGFFFDLSRANGYEARLIALTTGNICVPLHSGEGVWEALQHHPELSYSAACAVLCKTSDLPFATPIQGMWMHQSSALGLANMPRVYPSETRPNLALHRPAIQSSTSQWSWHDDPALDAAGANNGQITGYYGFHTETEPDPWWMVDLGGVTRLSEVVVYNRLDDIPWARRSAHLKVALSEDGEIWREVFARADDTPFGGADGYPLRVKLADAAARYVRVSLPGRECLHLDEVEVY